MLRYSLLLILLFCLPSLSCSTPAPKLELKEYPQITLVTLCGELVYGLGNTGRTVFQGTESQIDGSPEMQRRFLKVNDAVLDNGIVHTFDVLNIVPPKVKVLIHEYCDKH